VIRNLGKVAYEAYCATTDWKSAVSGDSLPSWEQQRESIRDAWDAAAYAVADAVRPAPTFQEPVDRRLSDPPQLETLDEARRKARDLWGD
jgi:hypothetical protein